MDQFSRSEAVLGTPVLEKLQQMRVILFGVGGVGSWVAEALVRTGLRHICLVDDDIVQPSNLNRQLPALHSTLGQYKVDALRQRLLDIQPDADVEALALRYTADTADAFRLDTFDVCIDAIDDVKAKIHLILHASRTPGLTFLSSMGAARRKKAEHVRVAPFWKVEGCPLARTLRQQLRKQGHTRATLPDFPCVFSDEPAGGIGTDGMKGSLAHVTVTFSMRLVQLVLEECEAEV